MGFFDALKTMQPPSDYRFYPPRTGGGEMLGGNIPAPPQPATDPWLSHPAVKTAAPGATPTPTGATDPIAYIKKRQGELPPTTQSLQTIFNELKNMGINVEIPTHAGGTKQSLDKIVVNGAVYDLLGSVNPDGSSSGWGFTPDDYWVDGKPSRTPGVYTPPAPGPGGGGLPPGYEMGNAYGGGQYPTSSARGPGLASPFDVAFQPPTGTDDPGFQFALQQGMDAIQKSAAAKGTLLTGGTLKDLASFTTGKALQGYGDAWNRGRTQWMDAQNLFFRNNDTLFSRLGDLGQSGFQAAQQQGQNTIDQGNANAGKAVATNAVNSNLATGGLNIFQDWLANRKKGKLI